MGVLMSALEELVALLPVWMLLVCDCCRTILQQDWKYRYEVRRGDVQDEADACYLPGMEDAAACCIAAWCAVTEHHWGCGSKQQLATWPTQSEFKVKLNQSGSTTTRAASWSVSRFKTQSSRRVAALAELSTLLSVKARSSFWLGWKRTGFLLSRTGLSVMGDATTIQRQRT